MSEDKRLGLIIKKELVLNGSADRYSRYLYGMKAHYKFLVKGVNEKGEPEERWIGNFYEYKKELEGTFTVGDWVEYEKCEKVHDYYQELWITRNLSHEERIKNFEKEYKKRLALIKQTQNTGKKR